MILKRLLQRWNESRSRYMTLDENAYKIPIVEMDKVLERTKDGKVIFDHRDYGVDSSDAIMSFWAYVNKVASYNLRYGCYPAWQDINECEEEMNFKRNLFFIK